MPPSAGAAVHLPYTLVVALQLPAEAASKTTASEEKIMRPGSGVGRGPRKHRIVSHFDKEVMKPLIRFMTKPRLHDRLRCKLVANAAVTV